MNDIDLSAHNPAWVSDYLANAVAFQQEQEEAAWCDEQETDSDDGVERTLS